MTRVSMVFVALFLALSLISFVRVPTAFAATNGVVRNGSFNAPVSSRNGTALVPYINNEVGSVGYGTMNDDATYGYGAMRGGSSNVPVSSRNGTALMPYIASEEGSRGYGTMNDETTYGYGVHGYGFLRDGSFNMPLSHR